MVRQPEATPVSAKQLFNEVEGIYASLIRVEAKCCEVDARQHRVALELDSDTPNLSDVQWYGTVVLLDPSFSPNHFFRHFFVLRSFCFFGPSSLLFTNAEFQACTYCFTPYSST